MITGKDIYDVLAAIVPLYVAMFLAYGSVRWWGIFSPDQCSGINRFVAVFAVPLLSFHFISSNNIYAMDFRFLAADSLQKVVILSALCIWQTFSKRASSDWMITLFSLSTLPNTLVMGIPLLSAMYGPFSGDLMVQIVVLQSVIWYTLMLFMFEYRGAKLLIGEQFPETAASITSFKVESDVISLNGREPLQTDAEIGDDGRLHVVVKRSNTPSLASSRSNYYNYNKQSSRGNNHINSLASMNMTPRASNLTGVEIYSVQSSREPTPRGSSFNQNDFYAMFSSSKAASPKHGYTSSYGGGGAEVYSLQSSKVATPRTSNFEEEMMTTNKNSNNNNKNKKGGGRSMSGELFNNGGFSYPPPNPMLFGGSSTTTAGGLKKKEGGGGGSNNKDLHMFVWSSSASSPVSEGHVRNAVIHRAASTDFAVVDASKAALRREFAPASASIKGTSEFGEKNNNNSPGRKAASEDKLDQGDIEEAAGTSSKLGPVSGSLPYTNTNQKKVEETEDEEEEEEAEGGNNKNHQMPPASVMTRLILIMVWRKLIRNPNTYSSLAGVIWSLISFRYNIQMPAIVHGSIAILSDAGLGMAMFSLGLFMALQPRIIACGKSVATFSMAVRFLTGPAVIAATSIAVGLRGVLLHVAIVQAALPQGIVPFVFAKEYNVHPDILSTAVIFGMLVALPVTILYYVLLGL